MFRLLIAALIAILAGLQYQLWVGDGSYAQVHRLRADLTRIEADNAAKEKVNATLATRIARLKSGEAAAERLARTRMGLVGQNEHFFLTVEPDRPAEAK